MGLDRAQRRRLTALAGSALLHALLLAILLTRPAPALPPAADLVELEIIESQPASPAPAAVAASTASTPGVTAKHPGRRTGAPRSPSPSPPDPRGRGDSTATATGTSSWPAELASDRPVRALESGTFAVSPEIARSYGVGSTKGPNAGRTLHPDDPHDAAAEKAVEEADVREKVQGLAESTLARHRVDEGRVDNYYLDMKKAMEKAAADPPPLKEVVGPVAAAMRSYLPALPRYGRTGNPYAENERGNAELLRGDSLSQAAPFEQLSRQQDFWDGKFGSDIVALIEVRQAGDGKLLGHRLVASSGLLDFDSFVMGSVPKALEGLTPAPKAGMGLHADGLRSLWAFIGKIVYSQPVQGAGDAVYLVLGGSFEETTGDVYVNKIDKPKFVCRVKLLEVY